MNTKFAYTLLCGLATMFMSLGAQAGKVAGKNVLLLHGFNPSHVINVPDTDKAIDDALSYWETFRIYNNGKGSPEGLMGLGEDDEYVRVLHYPSSAQLEAPTQIQGRGNLDGVGLIVARQLRDLIDADFCVEQCLLITHSTGDLVARYVFDNINSLLDDDRDFEQYIVATIDMGGAGGGTELASIGHPLLNGMDTGIGFAKDLIAKFLNIDRDRLTFGDLYPGIMYNLQPNVARHAATQYFPAIPRFRIATTGNEVYGFLSKLVIKGGDDSVVPLHSTCGSSRQRAYDSCDRQIKMNGEIRRVRKAPSLDDLYPFHYPLIMSETMPHNDLFKALGPSNEYPDLKVKGREMTVSLMGYGKYLLDAAFNTEIDYDTHINLDLDERTKRAWWGKKKRYRTLKNAKALSMAEMIQKTFTVQ